MVNLPPRSEELIWPTGMVPFSVLDVTIQRDPYAHYAWMRENAPCLRASVNEAEFWFLSRYDDVTAVLKDPGTFSSQTIDPAELPFLLVADPPEHTRLRKAVSQAFTTGAVSNLDAFVRDRVTTHWQRFEAQGGGDAFQCVAQPIVLETIAHMIGIPAGEASNLIESGLDVRAYFARIARRMPGTPNDEAATQQVLNYFRDALMVAADQGEETIAGNIARLGREGILTEKEMTHLCAMLLIAGSETTALAMVSGIILLCRQPDLLDRLANTPDDIGKFVVELTRFYGPAQRLVRVVTRDTVLGDYKIPAGTELRLLVGSANRDSRRFPNGDQFDIDRRGGGSIAFGLGVHACLGMHLARHELTTAFNMIANSGKRLHLDTTQPVRYLEGGSMATTGPISAHVDLY